MDLTVPGTQHVPISVTYSSQDALEVCQRMYLKVVPVHFRFLGVFLCAVCFLLRLLPAVLLTTHSILLLCIVPSHHVQHTEDKEDSDGHTNAGRCRP